MSDRRLFALDQNFPQPIVAVLANYIPEAELVPIGDINPRMSRLEDWEVLLALYNDRRPWGGLITNDASMLSLPREMSVLIQTKLTLVVAEATGHDPIKATGLVLAHLPSICERTTRDVPQVWHLRTAARPHDDPWDRLKDIAKRSGGTAKQQFNDHKLSDDELTTSPLIKRDSR
ncbi:MAG: hypothetical protein ACXV5L_00580 [Thermoanaerobaculia bacterium]